MIQRGESNGGGLIYMGDDFYKLVRKIEYTVRKVLNIKLTVAYAGENLRKMFFRQTKGKLKYE